MRNLVLIAACLLSLVAAAVVCPAANPAPNHKVLAFYYTWYGTPQFQNGRWMHWNECRACVHDPTRTVEVVSPRTGKKLTAPDSGSKNHPAKLYDSNDPAVVREHLRIAERAGIDALIVTWWGQNSYEDRALKKALEVAKASKSPVRFTIYYEQAPPRAADPVQGVIEDFRYLLREYGSHPAFFTEGGRPVFFVYGRAMGQLKPEQWKQAIAGIRAIGPAVLMADGLTASWLELFDGLHEYNPARRITEKVDMAARYRNTVEMCRPKKKISTATIIPGYDDSNIGRERVLVAEREKGDLYRRLWQYAIGANPDWVLITTFNEWHEGSEIEASTEWGDLFLGLTRDFARKFKKQ